MLGGRDGNHIEWGCNVVLFNLRQPVLALIAQGWGVRRTLLPKDTHPPVREQGGRTLRSCDFSLFNRAPRFTASKAFFTTPSSTGRQARNPWPWAPARSCGGLIGLRHSCHLKVIRRAWIRNQFSREWFSPRLAASASRSGSGTDLLCPWVHRLRRHVGPAGC